MRYFYLSSVVLVTLTLLYSCSLDGRRSAKKGIFTSVEPNWILSEGGRTRGVAWGDHDNDGDPDLYITNSAGQPNSFFINEGNGIFRKASMDIADDALAGASDQGVNWVDYDNDRDLDLFIATRGEEPCVLLRNDETEFTKVENNALVDGGISVSMACWADIEGDGDLDVLLTGYKSSPNMVFRNIGNGDFERVADNPLDFGFGEARSCGCGDSDDDGLPEFYIGNAKKPNIYYLNKGNWVFDAMIQDPEVGEPGYSYGVSWADFDGDLDQDLFVANFDMENSLYRNDGEGNLELVTEGELVTEKGGASKGHAWGDYDNDGDLDLYVGNGTYGPDMFNFLYLNNGDGTFTRNRKGVHSVHADTSAGVANADYDLDGDLDLFVANWGGEDEINRLYENTTKRRNWMTVRLSGSESNSYGIGAKVILSATLKGNQFHQARWMYPVTGYAGQNEYKLHFGLGRAHQVDSLVIQWPSGQKDVHQAPAINTHFIANEGGSLIPG